MSGKSAHLFYRSGTADREYKLEIVGNEDNGFQVAYHYGRRGSKLKSGFKNPVPTDLATVDKLYEKTLKDQLTQGYKPQDGGTEYMIPEALGKTSGLVPQLLNKITEEEALKLLLDDAWAMQEKHDGARCMIRKKGKVIEGINKLGMVVSLPKPVEEAIKAIVGRLDCVVDGELVGEQFRMFDLRQIGVHAIETQIYALRLEAMVEWGFMMSTPNFVLVKTAVGKASKRDLFKFLKESNAEGAVFKRLDSIYQAGRPNSGGDQLKFKFYATAHVRVRAINTKRSVQMEVLDKGDWRHVGDVTVLANQDVPKVGTIIDVRYLYAYPQGDLFQTTIKGVRTDVTEDECLQSQLKYKQGSE